MSSTASSCAHSSTSISGHRGSPTQSLALPVISASPSSSLSATQSAANGAGTCAVSISRNCANTSRCGSAISGRAGRKSSGRLASCAVAASK
ncbi:MAG: hypothetical protein ACU837_03270 [Gammaproteobacteria bacterium]